MQISKQTKIVLAANPASAATTAVESSVIDTANALGVRFLGTIATQAADNTVKVQQGSLANGSDMADLAGTELVTTSNNDAFAVDVYKPTKRYVRAVVTRGTSTAAGAIFAEVYGVRTEPPTNGTTVVSESHVSPLEGTA